MNYFVFNPPSYGQLADEVSIDYTKKPVELAPLVYEFIHPPNQDMIHGEYAGHCLVTEQLCQAIIDNELSGCKFLEPIIERYDQFHIAYPEWKDAPFPEFLWMKVWGVGLENDFGVYKNHLIISRRALGVLSEFHTNESEVVPFAEYSFNWNWEEKKKEMLLDAVEWHKEHGLPLPPHLKKRLGELESDN